MIAISAQYIYTLISNKRCVRTIHPQLNLVYYTDHKQNNYIFPAKTKAVALAEVIVQAAGHHICIETTR